jgi:hypothetical protein
MRVPVRLSVARGTELRRIVHAPDRDPALEANGAQVSVIEIREILAPGESNQMRAIQLRGAEDHVLARG